MSLLCRFVSLLIHSGRGWSSAPGMDTLFLQHRDQHLREPAVHRGLPFHRLEGDTGKGSVTEDSAVAPSGKELPMTSTRSTEEGDPPD